MGMQRAESRALAWLALVLTVPVPSVAVVCAMFLDLGVVGQGVWGLSKLVQVAGPWVFWVWVLRRRVSWSALPAGREKVAMAWGVGSGLVIAGVICAGYAVMGDVWFDDAKVAAFKEQAAVNGLNQAWKFLGFAGAVALTNSLMEEYFWRWFVGGRCERIVQRADASSRRSATGDHTVDVDQAGGGRCASRAKRWGAIVLCAGLFTVHHIIALAAQFDVAMTVLTSSGVFIGGVLWSWMYGRFRSVWPGYVSHMLVNIGMFVPAWHLLFVR